MNKNQLRKYYFQVLYADLRTGKVYESEIEKGKMHRLEIIDHYQILNKRHTKTECLITGEIYYSKSYS